MSVNNPQTLYERLGGYDAISAVVDDLLPRLTSDALLGRFWEHRGADGLRRERQLLVDFLCSSAGGPLYYTGRSMATTHIGMRIDETDWQTFLRHVSTTLSKMEVGESERLDVLNFIESTKPEIVEC